MGIICILDSEVSAGASDGGPEQPCVCCPQPWAHRAAIVPLLSCPGTAPQLLRVLLPGCFLKLALLFLAQRRRLRSQTLSWPLGFWSEVHGKHPLL